MEITDELYADLSKRIKAGEFLKKGATFASLPSFSEGASSASLPSLPEGADERMQSFYEDCKASRALDQKKIKALENEIQALKDEAKARMGRNDANEAIAEFNSALATDYDNYKAESEKTITTLKEALDDARKLSTDALDRNKKLLKEPRMKHLAVLKLYHISVCRHLCMKKAGKMMAARQRPRLQRRSSRLAWIMLLILQR